MQQLKTKRVGIYVRVSTEMQSTEGYSIDGQINQIKEYCDFHHFEVKDIYADRGISGKSMNRPDLQRMLKDAKEGNIDCVMVYKTNRLARNTSDLQTISAQSSQSGRCIAIPHNLVPLASARIEIK